MPLRETSDQPDAMSHSASRETRRRRSRPPSYNRHPAPDDNYEHEYYQAEHNVASMSAGSHQRYWDTDYYQLVNPNISAPPGYPISRPFSPRSQMPLLPPAPGPVPAMASPAGLDDRVPPPEEPPAYIRRRDGTHARSIPHSPDPNYWSDDDDQQPENASDSHADNPDRDRYPMPTRPRYYQSSYRGRGSGGYYDTMRLDDDMFREDRYQQFSLAFLAGMEESSRNNDSLDFDVASDDRSLSVNEELKEAAAKGMKAYTSLYTGIGEPGGHHSASIVAVHDQHKDQRPLFRWRHIPQGNMNFEKFWGEANAQPGFTDNEKAAMRTLKSYLKTRNLIKSRYNLAGNKVGYMAPGSVEIPVVSPRVEQDAKSTPAYAGSVRWLCLEYMCLRPYSGLSAASDQSVFPSQTLLQAHYSRTNKQRDMEQAVCLLGNATEGSCFHVEQLWCLVLKNHLITCGNMHRDELLGDTITVVPGNTREPPPKRGRIIVSYKDQAHWCFSPDECGTWFELLSKFRDFWSQAGDLAFTYKNRQIDPSQWTRLVNGAKAARSPLSISLILVPRIPIPPNLSLNPLTREDGLNINGRAQASMGTTRDRRAKIHVLTLSPTKGSHPVSGQRLQEHLLRIERFMTQQTSYADSRAYKACKEVSRVEVHQHLQEMGPRVDDHEEEATRRAYQEAVELYNYAEAVFELFLPLTCEGPTTRKFWGAVKTLTTIPNVDEDHSDASRPGFMLQVPYVKSLLRSISGNIDLFRKLTTHTTAEQRMQFSLNGDIVASWMHVLTAMIRPAAYQNPSGPQDLVAEGLYQILEGELLTRPQINGAIMPGELCALMVLRLIRNQSGGADNIIETYSQYLHSLDTEIRLLPSDRTFQRSVELVQQEISVVSRILSEQQEVLFQMQAGPELGLISGVYKGRYPSVAPRGYYGVGASGRDQYYSSRHTPHASAVRRAPIDSNPFENLHSPYYGGHFSLRSMLLTDSRAALEECSREFRRYGAYAEDLGRAVVNKVNWTKDRHENAIYAFTVVTIVFLPMSAVAGIFGMNTSDVRDMEPAQWLYWVVALPVTFGVILLGLWWTGELQAVFRWFTGGKSSHRGGVSGRKARRPLEDENGWDDFQPPRGHRRPSRRVTIADERLWEER